MISFLRGWWVGGLGFPMVREKGSWYNVEMGDDSEEFVGIRPSEVYNPLPPEQVVNKGFLGDEIKKIDSLIKAIMSHSKHFQKLHRFLSSGTSGTPEFFFKKQGIKDLYTRIYGSRKKADQHYAKAIIEARDYVLELKEKKRKLERGLLEKGLHNGGTKKRKFSSMGGTRRMRRG